MMRGSFEIGAIAMPVPAAIKPPIPKTQKGPMIESAAVAEPITDPYEIVCLELSAPNPEFHGTHLTLLESSSAIQLFVEFLHCY